MHRKHSIHRYNFNSGCAVIIVLVGLLFPACRQSEDLPLVVPAGAEAGELTRPKSCVYVIGDIEYAAECSTLTVPENRHDPDSRLIALPVMRIKATETSSAAPIFWLNGGPGQSNMRFSHPQDLTALLAKHDFVLVGYRGVDGSVVLDCPEITQALRNPPGTLLSDAGLESYGAAAAQCSTRLQTAGVDLPGYTMTETIDDMESARHAFDYQRISLLGVSYGTRLAMMYEWMYPESLHRVAMLEVNTPGHFVWEADMIEAQLQDYAGLCARDTKCQALSGDLLGTMRDLSGNMPDRWLLFPIDEDKVKLISFVMFHESIQAPGNPFPLYGPGAIDMWLAAAEGDFSGMVLASWLNDLFIPSMFTWGHLLAMGSDTGEYDNPDRDYPAEFDQPDLILGSPMALLIWGMANGWPASPHLNDFTELQTSEVETLLEAGSVDFMTPPSGAEELLPYLSHGQLVVLEEFGHGNTFWNSQQEARLHMLTTFFDTGQVDDSLYTYQPLDFDVGLGWPGLARIVVAVPLLIVVAIGVMLMWFVRRRRRRAIRQAAEQLKPSWQ